MLIRELSRLDDDFITVTVDGKEYVIEGIKHIPRCGDSPTVHLSLMCRFGGEGNLKR